MSKQLNLKPFQAVMPNISLSSVSLVDCIRLGRCDFTGGWYDIDNDKYGPYPDSEVQYIGSVIKIEYEDGNVNYHLPEEAPGAVQRLAHLRKQNAPRIILECHQHHVNLAIVCDSVLREEIGKT